MSLDYESLKKNNCRVLYSDKFELPLEDENSLSCKICQKPLRFIKKRKYDYIKVCSCPCQAKKGNLAYLKSVFGDTDLAKKYWKEYSSKAYDRKPLKQQFEEKYGIQEGQIRYDSFLKKCNLSLKGFIDRHGEEEGLKKYEEFKKKSLVTKDAMIKRHGEEEGTKRYNGMVEKMRMHGRLSFGYWLNFFNGDYELASVAYKKEQSRNIRYFVEKYGEEEGSTRYKKLLGIRKIQNTVEYRIAKHGEKLGLEKWKKEKFDKSYHNSLAHYKQKFGDKLGLKLYQDLNKKKSLSIGRFIEKFGEEVGVEKYIEYKSNFLKGRSCSIKKSKFQFDFIEDVIKHGRFGKNSLLCNDNELLLFDDSNGAGFYYDICNPQTKRIVEIHGDYWHANPEFFSADAVHPVKKKKASEIWALDKKRLDMATKCGYEIMVLWEKDIRFNRYPEIRKCIKFLKGKLK